MGSITAEGTVSGNVLTATITSQEGKGMTLKFTMSSDGKSFTYEQFYANGTKINIDVKDGNRLSRVTYIIGELNASGWAKPELEKANGYGLIPDNLKTADLTKPITRAEFAAVAVKVYENLSGTTTTPSPASTFTDTQDNYVLRAHNTGLMVGVSDNKFDPNTVLNRESAATALTRVLKRAYIPGWTFPTDGNYTLNYSRPATFEDDAQISGWAKDSVYFMAANNVIQGVGGNKFAPRATTTAEQAAGYATATREQAIIIGVRLVENLKDKPLNYTGG